MLNFWGPHAPYYAHKQFVDQYDELEHEPWGNFYDRGDEKPSIHDIKRDKSKTWDDYLPAIKHYYALIHYKGDRRKIVDYSLTLRKSNNMLLLVNEAYQIYMATEATKKIAGDIAEVGTYMGGSAKIICRAKGNKTLHLFDSFKGLPKVGDQ